MIKKKMTEIGLWIKSDRGETYLIRKDPNGYPDLILLSESDASLGAKEKKSVCRALYLEITGKQYGHPNATTRQVLWDFLETAIEHLP